MNVNRLGLSLPGPYGRAYVYISSIIFLLAVRVSKISRSARLIIGRNKPTRQLRSFFLITLRFIVETLNRWLPQHYFAAAAAGGEFTDVI